MSTDGAARRRRAQGAKADGLQSAMAALDPELVEWADGFIFDDVWGRDGISQDERMLVAITALAASKNPDQLKNYLHGALQAGTEPQKIHEALVMLVVYCGFPTALQALTVWHQVVQAERRRGTKIELRNGACG
jgi:4-carboxymuconolactone decarboxylase